MLNLILINVQYSQKAVFGFEKGSNHQNHYSSGSHYSVKTPPAKLSPPSLPLFRKPWYTVGSIKYVEYKIFVQLI